MSERFEKLYNLPSNLYSAGSPVVLAAGALLKDTETGKVVIQLKFHSVSTKTIKAIKTDISAFDVAGNEIEGINDYHYLDLNVNNGQKIGSNKAIMLPNVVTRSFSIKGITVILDDGAIYKVDMPLSALPESVAIQSVLKNAELIKQYQIATKTRATYIPQEKSGIWCCTCGQWNSGYVCSKCKADKRQLFESLDISALTIKMEERLAAEKAEREHQARLAEITKEKKEQQKEKAKKIVKKGLIYTSAMIVLVLIGFLIITNYQDAMETKRRIFENAVELMEDEDYEEAIEMFLSLGNYKGSNNLVEECRLAILDNDYNYAVRLMNEEKYSEAINAFEELNGHKDSKTLLRVCQEKEKEREYEEYITWYNIDFASSFLGKELDADGSISMGPGDYEVISNDMYLFNIPGRFLYGASSSDAELVNVDILDWVTTKSVDDFDKILNKLIERYGDDYRVQHYNDAAGDACMWKSVEMYEYVICWQNTDGTVDIRWTYSVSTESQENTDSKDDTYNTPITDHTPGMFLDYQLGDPVLPDHVSKQTITINEVNGHLYSESTDNATVDSLYWVSANSNGNRQEIVDTAHERIISYFETRYGLGKEVKVPNGVFPHYWGFDDETVTQFITETGLVYLVGPNSEYNIYVVQIKEPYV